MVLEKSRGDSKLPLCWKKVNKKKERQQEEPNGRKRK
jgi:hypothetical protein